MRLLSKIIGPAETYSSSIRRIKAETDKSSTSNIQFLENFERVEITVVRSVFGQGQYTV